jgi:hypothetical protein
MKLLLVILFLVNVNLLGSKIDNKGYDKKSNQYYKQYKKEFDRLPLKNKKKILEAYYTNEAYDLGFTMAGTMFLENRGMAKALAILEQKTKEIEKPKKLLGEITQKDGQTDRTKMAGKI